MPRPSDAYDLVEKINFAQVQPTPMGSFLPSQDFPFNGWGEYYRDLKIFHVAGYNEYEGVGHVKNGKKLRAQWSAAMKLLSDGTVRWSQRFPDIYKPNDRNHWTSLGATSQLDRVRSRRPVNFASACIAILTLELAIQAEGSGVDIYAGHQPYGPIRIRPLIYNIVEFDYAYFDSLDANDYAQLCRRTGQYRPVASLAHAAGTDRRAKPTPISCVFHEIADDRGVSARLVHDTLLHMIGSSRVAYTLTLDRTKQLRTAHLENINFP